MFTEEQIYDVSRIVERVLINRYNATSITEETSRFITSMCEEVEDQMRNPGTPLPSPYPPGVSNE